MPESSGTMHHISMGRSQKVSLKLQKICRSKSSTARSPLRPVMVALVRKYSVCRPSPRIQNGEGSPENLAMGSSAQPPRKFMRMATRMGYRLNRTSDRGIHARNASKGGRITLGPRSVNLL